MRTTAIPAVGRDYKIMIGFFASIMAACGPLAIINVFLLEGNRITTAYASFWAFDVAIYGMLITPWLPLKSLQEHSHYDRLSLMVLIWLITYILIALTFEIPWLLLYEDIAAAPEAMWSYFWMMYVDGGDGRYANPTTEIIFAEVWACINASIAAIALYHWYKSKKTSLNAIYAFMFCAVMHISPTAYYYVYEITHGFPNVDTSAAGNFIAKFLLSNSCWFWMPFILFYWCTQTIPRLFNGPQAERLNT